MSDTNNATPASTATVSPASEAQNWSEAWARAEAKAAAVEEAKEAAVNPKPVKPKPKLKPAPKPEPKAAKKVEEPEAEEPEEPAALPESPKAKKAAPDKAEKLDNKAALKAEEDDAEVPEPKAKVAKSEAPEPEEPEAEGDEEPEYSAAQLEALAKKLGYRIDGAAITTDERIGFRAEKRRFREKMDAERAELQKQLHAAENYYQPALKAKQAAEAGDYDAALQALGVKGGLGEANEKYIERQSGKDPRVSTLEQKLAEAEAREQARQQAELEQRQRFEQERAQREAVSEISTALSAHPHLSSLSGNEWFAQGVLKVQQEHWDGYETLSVEDAALENIQLLKRDPRAKMAYEALKLAFGSSRSVREAEIPEESAEEPLARRSDDTSVRPGSHAPPKTLPKRKAAEASAPHGPLTEDEWMKRNAARLRAASARD